MTKWWKPGKPEPELLKSILERLSYKRAKDVIVGPEYGEDAAAISLNSKVLVIGTDPITFTTADPGYYLVNVNANDIATMGAKPEFLLLVMLLPERGTDRDLVNSLIGEIKKAAKEMDITIVGGHTEVTPGLEKPILIGTMLGFTTKERLVTSKGAEPGDLLILTKGVAIEGTSIIVRERENLAREILGEESVSKVKNWLYDPGISVVREALTLAEAGFVKAMHDPTEGGLSMGIYEIAEASQVGALIEEEAIPIFEETRLLCSRLGIDPLGLIASGALLAAISPSVRDEALSLLIENKIKASVIGELKEKSFGVKLRREGKVKDLPRYPQDEILKIF